MRKLEREMKKNEVALAWHISYKNEAQDELTIDVWESTDDQLLSVIRRASNGNQSRIRVDSFLGRMSSLPAGWKPWENRRDGSSEAHREEESSRNGTRDRTHETNWTIQRNPFAARSAPAWMQNVTGDSFTPRFVPLWKYDPFIPSLRIHRCSLKSRAILGDPKRAFGNELVWTTIPFQEIVLVEELFSRLFVHIKLSFLSVLKVLAEIEGILKAEFNWYR